MESKEGERGMGKEKRGKGVFFVSLLGIMLAMMCSFSGFNEGKYVE